MATTSYAVIFAALPAKTQAEIKAAAAKRAAKAGK